MKFDYVRVNFDEIRVKCEYVTIVSLNLIMLYEI
jgi:hypothetical protein